MGVKMEKDYKENLSLHLYDFNRVVKDEQSLGIINEETHTGQGDLMSTGNHNHGKYSGAAD